ncbi:MAG: response regulator [Bacteroidota bacterium]|nr:response regulator [Bacteroidota bacterium]MDP4193296.1 response regulator [Bacteroidota bacterium]MDP4195821.1 response regulator [Bacteroidota bacterium]
MNQSENSGLKRVPLRIAIVEDEAIIARDMKQILEEAGHVVLRMFMVGEEAARKIPLLDVDLVLMDVFLRGYLSGIDVAELLMLYQNIPVVFVTGHSDPGIMAKMKYTGSYGIIMKPFSTRSFLTSIDIAYNNFIKQQKSILEHSKKTEGNDNSQIEKPDLQKFTEEQKNSIRSMISYSDHILNEYDNLSEEEIKRFAVKMSVCLKMLFDD